MLEYWSQKITLLCIQMCCFFRVLSAGTVLDSTPGKRVFVFTFSNYQCFAVFWGLSKDLIFSNSVNITFEGGSGTARGSLESCILLNSRGL